MEVHIVKNDYTPDAGSTIYGVFSTYELAEKCQKRLESPDNEYGQAIDDIDIDSYTIDQDY